LEEARILALDYGEKRIGLAVTDPLNMFAYPLVTINNDSKFWDEFSSIIRDYKIVKIIMGNPLKESGAFSNVTSPVLKFKEEIEKKFSLPVELVDERYTSKIAQQRIMESVSSKKKRKDKSLIDKNAAAILLEDYLSKMNFK
jgi:putative Holliday junction resolvase